MDAITLLKEDHKHVKKLLEQGDSTTERAVKTRKELLTTLEAQLSTHEAIEEELFYPALKTHAEAKEIVLEGFEEHDVVDAIMLELAATPVTHETWAAKFSVMKENLEHHIEEEEGDMFPKARDLMSAATLKDLGEKMLARKKVLTN